MSIAETPIAAIRGSRPATSDGVQLVARHYRKGVRLDTHMRRLQHSAKIYRMEYPLDLIGWQDAVLKTIRANEMKACYIRPIVFLGYGDNRTLAEDGHYAKAGDARNFWN